jgi:phosphatidylserine/phosphatidylglycerophosphate/cardiolipin synthase-like enzyme
MARRKRRQSSRTSRRPVRWLSWVLLLLLLGAAYLAQSGALQRYGISIPGISPTATPEAPLSRSRDAAIPATDGAAVEVFFTTPWLVYPDEPEQRTPPPHEAALLADIAAASSSVEAALFEYNLESLADALIGAHARGVAVRLALDRENLEDPEEAHWAGRIEEAGIPIAWQDTTAFQHSKFFIIDEQMVWMGSWNASQNGTYRNNNNLLRLRVPAIVENYRVEFAQMMGGSFGNQKEARTPHPVVLLDDMRIENYFSPREEVSARIVERLAAAQHSIRFLAFAFTSDEIAQAMVERQAAGVAVQGVFENRSASGLGAEFARLEEAGADVWRDGNCYTMHHKVMIIDEVTVITGSYNFTARAEDTNDENLLIIDSPELAAEFLSEFARVYEQAQNPTRCGG